MAAYRYHRELIAKIVKEYKGKKYVQGVILFGSHALGIETPESDVDIYIFVDEEDEEDGAGAFGTVDR